MNGSRMKYYAHSLEGEPEDKWQLLEEHLTNTAELAKGFAQSFASGEWAYLAGLWHDLGKYSKEFQAYLRGQQGQRVDYATAGGQQAVRLLEGRGRLLAYVIAGHHAGLPNGKDNDASCLSERLTKNVANYERPAWFDYPPKLERLKRLER